MKTRLALLVIAAAGCGKSADTTQPAADPPAKAATTTAPAKTAPGPFKAIVMDTLGIVVDAPSCAEVTPIDPTTASVSPADPTCSVPFPGVVFAKPPAAIEPTSLAMELEVIASDSRKPEITRKETLPDGWAVSWKAPATADQAAELGIKTHRMIGGALITCQWHGQAVPEQLEQLSKICASARTKS